MMNRQVSINQQRGIVLFIAMVALVVMSLAAAALIRSVDTNTKIAGNLALKQSTLMVADRGVEAAVTWLNNQNLASLNDSALTGNRYFAVYGDLDNNGSRDSQAGNLDNLETLKNDATWTGWGVDAIGGADTNNNRIRYIIERMCEAAGEPARTGSNKCLLAAGDAGGDGKGGGDNESVRMLNLEDAVNPIYRVTVRVAGPKNTESYTQVYVY